MAGLVKTNHYRVGYKFPRQKAVTMNYTSETLAMLMRNLQFSEGVNRDTGFLVVIFRACGQPVNKAFYNLDNL